MQQAIGAGVTVAEVRAVMSSTNTATSEPSAGHTWTPTRSGQWEGGVRDYTLVLQKAFSVDLAAALPAWEKFCTNMPA